MTKNNITLITGGVGSGKTHQAMALAAAAQRKVYLATAPSNLDPEMDAKIVAHQDERDETWTTVEEPIHLADAYRSALQLPGQVILVDCLTLWASNLVFSQTDPAAPLEEFIALLSCAERQTIIVTNEVSLGVIPADAMTRSYCKLLARINRQVAQIADEVQLMVSGIPVSIKGRS